MFARFARRTHSVLLVDFDNVMGQLGKDFVDRIPQWLAWLEDGQFEPSKRKRTFVHKRMYWNTPFEVHREIVELHGFKGLLTPSRVKSKKSAADMVIALDALGLAYDDPRLEECVLLAIDTDYEPLLEKLGDRNQRTVIMADPTNVSIEVFRECADVIIPLDSLKLAMTYERKRRALEVFRASLQRWLRALRGNKAQLKLAAKCLAEIGKATPGLAIAKKKVTQQLAQKVKGFQTIGDNAYFGAGNYDTMIEQIADTSDELFLHEYAHGGRAISWRPKKSS